MCTLKGELTTELSSPLNSIILRLLERKKFQGKRTQTRQRMSQHMGMPNMTHLAPKVGDMKKSAWTPFNHSESPNGFTSRILRNRHRRIVTSRLLGRRRGTSEKKKKNRKDGKNVKRLFKKHKGLLFKISNSFITNILQFLRIVFLITYLLPLQI